jgi:hypothetical protein
LGVQAPISTNSTVKPTAAPNTCFWLAAKPKRAPELSATTLTGPGVMEVASAKAAMERIKLMTNPCDSEDNVTVKGRRHLVLNKMPP